MASQCVECHRFKTQDDMQDDRCISCAGEYGTGVNSDGQVWVYRRYSYPIIIGSILEPVETVGKQD